MRIDIVNGSIVAGDGKAVLEVIFAAYESAGTNKKVFMPFKSDIDKPYKLWKKIK